MITEQLPETLPETLQPLQSAAPSRTPKDPAPPRSGTYPYYAGLILIAISAGLFFLPQAQAMEEDDAAGLFGIHFLITAAYGVYLLISGATKKGRGGIHCVFNFLLLFLISAYALNRTITVFEESAAWLGTLLVTAGASCLILPYLKRLPVAARQAVAGVIGVALMLWLYLACYLAPMYPLSLLAAIGAGISLHTFVPALLLLFTLRWILQALREDSRLSWGLSAGAGLAIIVTAAYITQWSTLKQVTGRSYQHSLIDDSSGLPSWVKVSRTLPDNWATEAFLKGDLVYSTAQGFDGLSFWDMPSRRLNEVRKHDPLVMLASLFAGVPSLNREDRIRILESKFDARHRTEERLWNGAHLRTSAIITRAQIWPAQHLAYTEQIITVANTRHPQRWRGQEEAIYSFTLPEGSAVTSLSLWINGQESKGVLTTKGKASHAYKQIVGVESRDPSVVHWAEGNRISVRVFPVMAGENRVFKIGVTTPLIERDGRLVYQPMRFEGPRPEDALSTTMLHIEGRLQDAQGLSGFKADGKGGYLYEGDYDEGWALSFPAPRLQTASFSFNGYSYALQPYSPQRIPSMTKSIYLDLNSSWSRADFKSIRALSKDAELYAWNDGLVRINEENADEVFKAAQEHEFSLFPLFAISDPATSLLITSSNRRSPNLKDLGGSGFGAQLEESMKRPEKIRLFNLGDELSPYLKSLKEHRAFRYERGNTAELQRLLTSRTFAAFPETDNSIVMDDAGLRITRTAGMAATGGPDHLQRLFAYNHIIQHLGRNLYKNMEGDPVLMAEASEAYVVSPISSLVVLESAADYDRFDIRDKGASLRNASVQSSGAVPEPHEWALIILSAGLLFWLKYRPRLSLIKMPRK